VVDFHAVLVGVMLAMMVPAGVPWWLVLTGAVMAILVGKMPFGPLGGAPLSPALVGLLIASTSFTAVISTPLVERTAHESLKAEDAAMPESPQTSVMRDPSDHLEHDRMELFLGMQTGPWGTVSPLLLLLGGLFLLWRRVIRWQAPLGFLLGVWLAATVTHSAMPSEFAPASFQMLTGMVFFGAFFLCTEWSTTPVTSWGLFWYGMLAGVLAIVLRVSGVPYGRVPFAIMVTSLATPLFDRITATPFGKVVDHA
jgi:electron transport complex protein RnfD